MTASTTPAAVIVLTTIDASADASALARALVGERLAACVNILPAMTSVYRWKGAVEEAREHQLLMKTTAGRLAALEVRLRQLHPHDLPEFIVVEVAGGSAAYLAWVGECVEEEGAG